LLVEFLMDGNKTSQMLDFESNATLALNKPFKQQGPSQTKDN